MDHSRHKTEKEETWKKTCDMDKENQTMAAALLGHVTSGGYLGGSQTGPGFQGQVVAVPVRRKR